MGCYDNNHGLYRCGSGDWLCLVEPYYSGGIRHEELVEGFVRAISL